MNRLWQRFVGVFERVGADPTDDADLALQKRSLVALSAIVAGLAILWAAIYLAADEPVAASIPGGYSVLSIASIATFGITRRYRLFRASQLALILLLPFLLQVTLGGFVNSSAVILWAALAPLGALFVIGRRAAVYWFGGYLGLVVLSLALQPVVRDENNLSDGLIILFFVMNLSAVVFVTFFLFQYVIGQRDRATALLAAEQKKSERLLLNVLPAEIAAVLKEEETTIADHYPTATVLFADIVGFTPLSERMAPDEMVGLLNEVFTHFDSLCDRYGVEKIRTIGDNYMAASGVPTPRDDHATAMAEMALEMNAFLAGPATRNGLQLRFGINSGPLVAGVIGNRKFQYDIWGDTVNTASRMESHGVPGKIQITDATYQLIRDEFDCEPRGEIDVKGKGTMRTWWLVGARAEDG